MDVFKLRNRLVADYANYTRSFIKIADPRIRRKVDKELAAGAFWPEPLLQLNPAFKVGGTINDLVSEGTLHKGCARIFRLDKTEADPVGKQLPLYAHQAEAIRKAKAGKSYVLTSGTGSGKSLTYIVPIVDHVLRRGPGNGIQAIIVYPMNALANSQNEELTKFLMAGYGDGKSPVRFARYTGQEKGPEREEIRANPPDILLTNYMMLELLLTRREDRDLVRAASGLRFLVLDELHTYRGRQGADVALLIRRCRLAFGGGDMICVGTSATMTSGGSAADRKREVASVAATLFGTDVSADQVIEETLKRSTPELDPDDPVMHAALATAITKDREPPDGYDAFRRSPLASWIESTFGIRTEQGTGQLVRQSPRPVQGPAGVVNELAELTSADPESCAAVLRRYLLKGSELRPDEESRFPVFAFRLHQFLTRGDTVWTTLEPGSVRHIEMAKLGAKPGEPDKPLFPLVFCRHCGTEYYRVAFHRGGRGRLEPREDRGDPSDDSVDAWLYASEKAPWPDAREERLSRLPAFMKEPAPKGGERVRADARKDVPEAVSVDATGRIVPEGEGLAAALVTGNFLFCLNPGCGVAHARTQRSEKAKLGTLGVDNRSTATTILAVRSLVELQGDDAPTAGARKLLSFTDNRQDASLQAGHFNDFAQVALLRSALYKAILLRGPEGLEHGALARSVFRALRLRFEDYAADPDVRGPARQATDDALCQAINYFLYLDLQRGWRVTAPNLEDCGLLRFEYQGLTGADGLLDEEELWESGFASGRNRDREYLETPPALKSCGAQLREEILRTLLDVLRRQLAIKVDALDLRKQQELVQQTRPRLLEGTVWHLNEPRELAKSAVAYPHAGGGKDRTGYFVSSRGAFGQYVRRRLAEHADAGGPFGREEVDRIIRFLFRALELYGILEKVRSDDGYQINPSALRWTAGDGEMRPVDRTRLLEVGEIPAQSNAYFLECYRNFVDLECLLEAREHTAQVASEDREEREERFRDGALPLLFCSPTMELGVDIAQLNLVNLRNVPPTPANYAQRSGRAGRGGQPALVYTYCAGQSPHDQYYYRRPGDMVVGSVMPPRIDLRNRDLVRSHVHAIWMEVANADFGSTLAGLLDIRREGDAIRLPVKSSIRRALEDPTFRAAALRRAGLLVESISRELESATWFHDNWVLETLNGIVRSFETACDRWRGLYRAAVGQREVHHRIIGDPSRPEGERRHSKRLRDQAESQIRLLTEAEGIYRGDFYSYRYLATEGFLPGYNFPRLPLSAYVPGRRMRTGRDEFISRPRFLAISEFGPRTLIYHEGSRYRVCKVNLDFGSEGIESTHNLLTATMKRCPRCGYAHVDEGADLTEVCERCGAGLNEGSVIGDLVHLQNVSLRPVRRITCDEEERQRFGYRLVSAYRFPETGGPETDRRTDRSDSEVAVDDVRVMRLSYADATALYRINLGWAKQGPDQPDGFVLDLESGYWARNAADEDDRDDATADGRKTRVVPYVTDTRNALVMGFEPTPGKAEMAALQAAFREAIQKQYQLEPRELSAEAMPSPQDRREILFYEAAEGGAGVLRQLVDDPRAIPALARRALEICHFDPDTLDDLKADACGKACYECLLDYGNQPDHMLLDRHAIRDWLAELARSKAKPAGGPGSRAERLAALRKACDSRLELRWLDRLDALGLRLPSDAQFLIKACSTKPDFFYREYNAAVYVDGPPHDEADQSRDDEAITERLMDAGYAVLRFHHKADWDGIFRRHPDIFGTAGG